MVAVMGLQAVRVTLSVAPLDWPMVAVVDATEVAVTLLLVVLVVILLLLAAMGMVVKGIA